MAQNCKLSDKAPNHASSDHRLPEEPFPQTASIGDGSQNILNSTANEHLRKYLVVTADDFGQDIDISKGIIEAHVCGIVTSTSLMVNSEYTEQAVQLLKSERRSIALGLHFNLTYGRPISAAEEVVSLVDNLGQFPPSFNPDTLEKEKPSALDRQVGQVLRDLRRRSHPNDIRREIHAQFRRFLDLLGCLPTHLDSHHHIHRLPDVLNIVEEIAIEYHLPVRQVSPVMRDRLWAQGIPTTDVFVNRFWGELDFATSLNHMKQFLKTISRGTTELMCHPGHSSSELRRASLYSVQREQEIKLVCHPDIVNLILADGIELISTSQLHNVLMSDVAVQSMKGYLHEPHS